MSQFLDDALPTDVTATIDPETKRAVSAFVRRIAHYPVQDTILYGSRARGGHRKDSDADLAVVLKGKRGDRTRLMLDMAGIAFDAMLETGVLVQALPLWQADFDHPETFKNPVLIFNILRDGRRV